MHRAQSQPLNPPCFSLSSSSKQCKPSVGHPALHPAVATTSPTPLQLRELVLAEKRAGVPTAASSSAKDLTGTPPASPHQQQRQPDSNSAPHPGALEERSDAAPEVLGSIPSGAVGSKTPPPKRPGTAPCGRPSSSGGCSSAAAAGGSSAAGRYSSLSCNPAEWELEAGKPCSGEALLLMFDRWQKLAKTFFKKGKFDISKVRVITGHRDPRAHTDGTFKGDRGPGGSQRVHVSARHACTCV